MNNYKVIKQVCKNVGVQLYLLPIDENIKCINKSIIPAAQLYVIHQYKTQRDINKRLLTRSFLYEFLKKYYGICDFEHSYNAYHKPFLKELPSIHFSFSYAGDYVLIGIFNAKVGVDIEYVNPSISTKQIAPHIMCECELKKFNAYPENSRSQQFFFYKLFSAKESIIKAFGTGLYIDVKKINTMDTNQFIHQNDRFILEELTPIDDNYFLSICYHLEDR